MVILRPAPYDDWLSSTNPEFARALIELCPAEELSAEPAPEVEAKEDDQAVASLCPKATLQPDLF